MPADNSAALSLTVIILTHNEAHHLPRALAAIGGIARRIVVVDSGSTDDTAQIADRAGADVYHRDWVNYADQFQWAIDNTAIDTDWIMRLDADEWLGPDLTSRLSAEVPALGGDVSGISFDRRHYFLGRWIRHGGRYPLRLLRMWRRGKGHIEQRWMDEHIALSEGRIQHFAGEFVDENLGDLGFFTTKHNASATREAVDALMDSGAVVSVANDMGKTTDQAARKRSAKLRFYNRLPLGIGPLAYFIWRYIFQLGFLDGRAGLIYHVLQGFWYRFLVDAKRFELGRGLKKHGSEAEKLAYLEAATGLKIAQFSTNGGAR